MVLAETHPRADTRGFVMEHILVVEKAIGRYLVAPEEVHHFNKIKADNANVNLVLCPDRAYHQLLHRRYRIVLAGGNPETDKICMVCRSAINRNLFHRNRTYYDGLHHACKACRKKMVRR